MDAFEQLVAGLLEREGLWVRSSVKVNLTREDKARIKRPSSPRWELDLVAYRADTNEIRIIECKSYLYSTGVMARSFRPEAGDAGRYKLFTDRNLFQVVRDRLVEELTAEGWCRPNPTVTLCLVAGRIRSKREREALRDLFDREGWRLLDSAWLIARLDAAAHDGYDNDSATIIAKLYADARTLVDAHTSRRGQPLTTEDAQALATVSAELGLNRFVEPASGVEIVEPGTVVKQRQRRTPRTAAPPALDAEDMAQIQKELVLGLEPTLRTPEADAFRAQLKKEIDDIHARGGIVELPNL